MCLGAPYGPTIDSSCIWDRSGVWVMIYLAVINCVINFYYKNYYIILDFVPANGKSRYKLDLIHTWSGGSRVWDKIIFG